MKPNIDNLSHTNPFETPKEYFPNLEQSILSKTTGENSIQNSFKTPDFYFDKLESSIISEVATKQKENNKKGKIISLFTKRSYWLSAAACIIFAIIVGTIYTFNKNSENTPIAARNNAISIINELYNTDNLEEDTLSVKTNDSYEKPHSFVKSEKVNKNKSVSTSSTQISKSEEKISEVIYNLYFNDDDNSSSMMEEELFL